MLMLATSAAVLGMKLATVRRDEWRRALAAVAVGVGMGVAVGVLMKRVVERL